MKEGMKKIKELFAKAVVKVMENKEASTRFAIFLVIIGLALAYPLTAAIVGALACMIAIDNRKNAAKSLSFLKVPLDVAKSLSDEKKSPGEEPSAQEEAKTEVRSEVKPEENKQ